MKPTSAAAEPVGTCDANTHLHELIERAERGRRFAIIPAGRPVVQRIPGRRVDRSILVQPLADVVRRRARRRPRPLRLKEGLAPGEAVRGLARGRRHGAALDVVRARWARRSWLAAPRRGSRWPPMR